MTPICYKKMMGLVIALIPLVVYADQEKTLNETGASYLNHQWHQDEAFYLKNQAISKHGGKSSSIIIPTISNMKSSLSTQEDNEDSALALNISEKCIKDLKINIKKGLAFLAPSMQKKFKNGLFLNCATNDNVNKYIQDLTKAFIEQGYFKVNLDAHLHQEKENGQKTLDLEMTPAQIVEIENNTDYHTSNLFGFNAVGSFANIHVLDQALSQVNRLYDNSIYFDVYPKDKGVVINLKQKKPKKWLGILSYDNKGYPATGVHHLNFSFLANNLTNHVDMLQGSLGTSLGGESDAFSRSMNVFYSLPYGSYTWSIFGGGSYYQQEQKLKYNTAHLKGHSYQIGTGLSKVLYRDQKRIVNLLGQLIRLSSRNYFNETQIDISSDELTEVNLGLDYSQLLDKGSLGISLYVQQGLPILGAKKKASQLPNTNFTNFKFNLNFTKYQSVFGHTLEYRTNLNMAYSADSLPGIVNSTISSQDAVRGLNTVNLNGRRLVSLNNTLSMYFNHKNLFIKPYLTLDLGAISSSDKDASNAISVGTGVNFNYKGLNADFYFNRYCIKKNEENTENKSSFIASVRFIF